jgi:hypothetical protein
MFNSKLNSSVIISFKLILYKLSNLGFTVNDPHFFKFYIITGSRKHSNFHLKRENSKKFFQFRIKTKRFK